MKMILHNRVDHPVIMAAFHIPDPDEQRVHAISDRETNTV